MTSQRISTSMPKYWWIRMSRRPAIFCHSTLGSKHTEFGRQLFDRFADHLEIAHDGVERLLVRRKRLLR